MKLFIKSVFLHFSAIILATTFMAWMPISIKAEGYNSSLNGVKQVNAVFDVTLGDPKTANIVFLAVKDLYDNESVRALPLPPHVAVIFHGEAVKLISSDREGIKESERAAVNEFTDMVRQMKKRTV